MRVTIFGATGLLGKALLKEWNEDDVYGLGSQDADIREEAQVLEAVQRTQPDWIVLAAAYTDVDGCESNRDLAMAINCRGAINVARSARKCACRLLFISTDYVFDGTRTTPYETDDRPAPLNVYGQSKVEAEESLAQILPECCIARTSWLFGPGGRSFPEMILQLAASRPEIEAVSDQRSVPTYTPDLARVIVQLCRANASGIVHATNSGESSRFELTAEIVNQAGLKVRVRPATSGKFPRPAARPKYSVLSPRSLTSYGITVPPWQDAVRRYLAEKKQVASS